MRKPDEDETTTDSTAEKRSCTCCQVPNAEGQPSCYWVELFKFLFCCRRTNPPGYDFGRPTFREAKCLAWTNLVATLIFWIVSIVDSSSQEETSATIISVILESALDLASTVVFLIRFLRDDALDETPRNHVIEARCSAFFAAVLFSIGVILTGFATADWIRGEMPTHEELTIEVSIAFPSAIVYLIIGMLQLQMGWVLRLRSFTLDSLISIFGATSSLLAILAVIINLSTEEVDVQFDWQACVPNCRIYVHVHDQDEDDLLIFKYWWLEDLFAIIVGIAMMITSCYALLLDARQGSKFWTTPFWLDPLPADPLADPLVKGAIESTPLKADTHGGTR